MLVEKFRLKINILIKNFLMSNTEYLLKIYFYIWCDSKTAFLIRFITLKNYFKENAVINSRFESLKKSFD